MATTKSITFRRYGSSHHLSITSADDLRSAAALDDALWVATNAPVSTFNCDATFLGLLDADGDGRITCGEVKGAMAWLLSALADHSGIAGRSQTLRLEAVDKGSDVGRAVRSAAVKILTRANNADAASVTLAEVRRVKAEVEAMPVSEAGIVLPAAGADEQASQFVANVIDATGGAPHPCGRTGIAREHLDEFLAAAASVLQWRQAGRLPAGAEKTDILPLGERSASAWAALAAVRGKIDQYFAQCEAAALDERFTQRMGWTDSELEELDFDDPAVIENVLQAARRLILLERELDLEPTIPTPGATSR